jgi:hypothetical protein
MPKIKLNRHIIPIILAASALNCFAQDGSTAYNFLNVTSSSKIYGLGGVNITLVDDDISIIDQNPALLGTEMNNQVAFNYMSYLGSSNFAGLRYGHSAGEHGAWSAALQYFGYGSMQETLADGSIIGTFSPKDVNFSGAYSHDITDHLRGGIDMKFIYSGYADYTAYALATDLGINYFDPERDLSVSFVVANLGGQIKRFNEDYDRLPVDVRLGWSKSFGTFPIRFSVTAWNLTKWHLPYEDNGDGTSTDEVVTKDTFSSNLFRHLVFGADLISNPNFYLGIGYNYKTRTDMSTYNRSMLSGFSATAGIKVKSFGVGVALSRPHVGATTLMFNLSCNLNDLTH